MIEVTQAASWFGIGEPGAVRTKHWQQTKTKDTIKTQNRSMQI